MLLEKMLQSQGFGSRKHCQQLIKSGAVSIATEVITQPKHNIDPKNCHFRVYQQDFVYRKQVYIALHKPENYECSHQATHHHSVFDLFDDVLIQRGLQCVGRLDQDTTGLLLLSDDGGFIQALTHPKKHVPKVYQVQCADPIDAAQIQALTAGVALRNEKGIFAATEVHLLGSHQLSMTVHQGVYHQVKRMLAAVGNKVEQLHRAQIGQLGLDDLEKGQWIYLDDAQILAAKQQQPRST